MDAKDIENLIARVSLRDRGAFASLYDNTSSKLFGVCLRILKDRMDAEEALQEAFINVWRNSATFTTGRASAMSWLIAVARNSAIDRLRRRRVATGDPMPAEADEIEDEAPSPEAAAMAASDRTRLAECLEQLEEPQRKMVRRAFFSGRTYAELAVETDMPLGTVKSWIRRSLMKLRRCLEEAPPGSPPDAQSGR